MTGARSVPAGSARVSCWCEKKFVSVPLAEIRAGLTRPCAVYACQRTDSAERSRVKVKA